MPRGMSDEEANGPGLAWEDASPQLRDIAAKNQAWAKANGFDKGKEGKKNGK